MIKENDNIDLLDVIYQKITSDGLYVYNKTDLYDYLIYLLDKEKDLLSKSNAELSRILKISPSKVSALRANISVKFMELKEYEMLFDKFISSLNSTISIKQDEKYYIFTIEDAAIRNYIEACLKEICKNTADYTLNKEKIKILKDDFFKLLKGKKSGDKIEEIIKKLQNDKLKDNFLKFIDELVELFPPAKVAVNTIKRI